MLNGTVMKVRLRMALKEALRPLNVNKKVLTAKTANQKIVKVNLLLTVTNQKKPTRIRRVMMRRKISRPIRKLQPKGSLQLVKWLINELRSLQLKRRFNHQPARVREINLNQARNQVIQQYYKQLESNWYFTFFRNI